MAGNDAALIAAQVLQATEGPVEEADRAEPEAPPAAVDEPEPTTEPVVDPVADPVVDPVADPDAAAPVVDPVLELLPLLPPAAVDEEAGAT